MKKILLILSLLMLSAIKSTVYSKDVASLNNDDFTEINKMVVNRMDSIKAKVDSVNAKISIVTKNTDSKKLLGGDIDWYNFAFAFLAFLVACFSAVYDFRGFRESKRTADNVTRVSIEVQIAQFEDLIRHLYRNLVCTTAFSKKILDQKEHLEYPSEEHLLKLKVLPEDVLHLEKYNNNNDIYRSMHELKLLLRNYDIEIETAMMHLKDYRINLDVLKNDLDTLIFKPLYLTKKIIDITYNIIKQKEGNSNIQPFYNAAVIITKEHISKLNESDNHKLFDISNFRDLNFVDSENKIERPYDGLRRSRNAFLKATNESGKLKYDDIYTTNTNPFNYYNYNERLEYICNINKTLNSFKNDITIGEFDFKKHLLTMLSIDATIEFKKIHMIKIIKKNNTDN